MAGMESERLTVREGRVCSAKLALFPAFSGIFRSVPPKCKARCISLMILRHSIWYAVVLVVVWSALGEADRCENLQEPYFLFAGDGKSRLLVDGFTWSVSPTYLDQNYQVQVYTDSAMGLQFQGIQEIANDQNDLCAVDGGIHHYDYPYTGADMLRTINTSSLNCEYSQFVQYIAAANVTLNTTSIIASTPALPGFYITANLSTSDKEYLFTTYTDPATGHNLISSYKYVKRRSKRLSKL